MKCPKCKSKFTMLGNSKEEMGVTILECPQCNTKFELHAMQKMFPKGMFILLLLGIPFTFVPPVVTVVLIVTVSIPFIKWLYKPENIVFGEKNAENT